MSPSRIKVVAGGERSGKSYVGALQATIKAVDETYESNFQKPLLYWIVGQDFEDARTSFNYVFDFVETLGIMGDKHILENNSCSVSFTKGLGNVTFRTISGYDPTKVAREAVNGIIGEEISRWDKELWDRCYGRLMPTDSWGVFGGSFETSLGWFPEVWEMGQGSNELDIDSFSMPSWANPSLYPGGYDDPGIQKLLLQRGEVKFMERHAGKPAPPQDSVLPEFKSVLHVTEQAEFDPNYPVHLAIDPGTVGYAVLFVQAVSEEVRIVDEVYVSQWSHEQVVNACTLKPAWLRVSQGTIDIAGTYDQQGLGTAAGAWNESTGISLTGQKWPVEAELERLRSMLSVNPMTGRPYLRIHPRCRGIISEMGGGPSPVKHGGRWVHKGGVPEKKNDHACKALSYWGLANFGTSKTSTSYDAGEGVSWMGGSTDDDEVNILMDGRKGVNPWLKT